MPLGYQRSIDDHDKWKLLLICRHKWPLEANARLIDSEAAVWVAPLTDHTLQWLGTLVRSNNGFRCGVCWTALFWMSNVLPLTALVLQTHYHLLFASASSISASYMSSRHHYIPLRRATCKHHTDSITPDVCDINEPAILNLTSSRRCWISSESVVSWFPSPTLQPPAS